MDVAGTIHRHHIGPIVTGATKGGGPLMGTRRVEFRDKHVVAASGGDVSGSKVHRPEEAAGDMDVAGTIHRHPIANVLAGAAEGGGPLMSTSSVEFGDKPVVAAGGGDVSGPKVHRAVEDAGDMDVAGTIHRHPIANVLAGAAEGGGPLMSTSSVEFGDKPVVAAGGGDVSGPKVHRAVEDAGDMDVAGTIHRHPIANVGAGAAEGGGPLMGTSRIQFGDKHIVVAGRSDVAGPEIHCASEAAGAVDVAGTIHRHILRLVYIGAAKRD